MEAGVLALQGGFREHKTTLCSLGVSCREVRLPHQLEGLDSLIIPGGESTTIGNLASDYGFIDPLRDFACDNRPVWGTCAGAIFMSKTSDNGQPVLGLIDIVVERNAFGRQVDSFEADVDAAFPSSPGSENIHDGVGTSKFLGVFIRAPAITEVGPLVDVVGRLATGEVVAARERNLLATVFHPELTDDYRFHEYFLDMSAKRTAL
jgi:5'-phosphate synthase pdxT subunit